MSPEPQGVFSELWVCFEPPAADPPSHALILSFMTPTAETTIEQRWGSQIVSGRILVDEVRARARAEYLRLIARIGSTPCVGGRTLRQALHGPGNYSRWWLLDVTEKDCLLDEDTTYVTIMRLMAIDALKDRYSIERVRLHGAAPEFASALGEAAAVRGSIASLVRSVGFGLLARLAVTVEYVRLWWTLRRLPVPPPERRDVLLQAYWDWTVRPDGKGGLRDRYFTTLPARLASRGVSVGWLACFEPYSEPWQRGRRRRDVVAASRAHGEITLVERYLSLADVVRVTANLRYPIEATRFLFDRQFRRLCRAGAFDLYPLIRRQLLRAVWGGTFCRLQLAAAGTSRACRQLRPRIVLALFELLLRSRAFYAGVRASSPGVRLWAAQHAGYSSDKTLGVFDPDVELRGAPDGCAVPAPDGIFVLGDLSRRIWEANGLAPEHVVPTGGLRFQDVRIDSRAPRAAGGEMSVLLAGGMCEAAHLDLCDAVVAAASGLASMRIRWRDHPNYVFSRRPAFRRFLTSITVTSGTVEEDLQAADLVLFTQTGLAEEALLRGIPTWQWLWPGFNTSPFLDVPVIPTFTSVLALRSELEAFLKNPTPYQPAVATQRRVLHECFGSEPAAASVRIADAIQQMIRAQAVAHT
jgi:surface carbohydrate biosynthesis protein (TIGR04326 family)